MLLRCDGERVDGKARTLSAKITFFTHVPECPRHGHRLSRAKRKYVVLPCMHASQGKKCFLDLNAVKCTASLCREYHFLNTGVRYPIDFRIQYEYLERKVTCIQSMNADDALKPFFEDF